MKMQFTLALLSLFALVCHSLPVEEDAGSYVDLIEDRALQQYLMEHKFLTVEDIPDRIVGGEDASIGEAPFQAQLHRKVLFSARFLCGGSLISPKTVLTAGHCVSHFFNYRIRYGSSSRLSSPYPDVEIARIRTHPRFDLATVQNDLALFILKKPIQPSSNVKTISLETSATPGDTSVTLYGFGLTEGTSSQPATKMQKTTLNTLTETECRKYVQQLGVPMNPGMICARAKGKSACNGDSGGPLVGTESRRQVGIVSFGTRYCPPGSVNVYTNVSHYVSWIKSNME